MDDLVKSKGHVYRNYRPHDHQRRAELFRTLAHKLDAAGDHEGSRSHESTADYHLSRAGQIPA